MKFRVTFKTPDAVDDAIDEYGMGFKEEIQAAAHKFVTYGEYVTIEFDTKTKTAIVVPK
jgi:hypothetical protein